jgi:glycosyltransferase involved in cell wall biosynthesis
LIEEEQMSDIAEKYILITSSNFPEGGPGANYLNLFCRGLLIHGTEISVYLLKGHAFGSNKYNGPRTGFSSDGVPFTYLGFRQRPDNILLKLADQFLSFMRLQALLLNLLVRGRPVTILLYNSDLFFNVSVHIAGKLANIKVVKFAAEIIDKSQYRSSILGRVSRAAYMVNFRYLNKMSDKLLVFSHYLKDEFLKMGFDEQKILVQPNLTDFEFWKPEKVPVKYTLGYSGAPYMKDGLKDLLMAVKILTQKGLHVSLLIVGDATFGRSLIPGLKAECEKLEIKDWITFTGLVDSVEVKNYLSQCQILAITRPDTIQTKAGFPTKLGEYFALRKPILATRFGDMEKYFKDGIDLILAACDDPKSIAGKLEWMIHNQEKLTGIASNGNRTAEQLLEFNSSMKRILEFLTSK